MLRRLEVGGDGEHALLDEAVDLGRRGAHQIGVADQQRDLLLGGGAEVEAVRDAAGELDRRRVLSGGLEDQRGEQEPLGVVELRMDVLGVGVGGPHVAHRVHHPELVDLRRIGEERVGAPPTHRGRELRQRPFEHAGRLQEPPGAARRPSGATRRGAACSWSSTAAACCSTPRSSRAGVRPAGRRARPRVRLRARAPVQVVTEPRLRGRPPLRAPRAIHRPAASPVTRPVRPLRCASGRSAIAASVAS